MKKSESPPPLKLLKDGETKGLSDWETEKKNSARLSGISICVSSARTSFFELHPMRNERIFIVKRYISYRFTTIYLPETICFSLDIAQKRGSRRGNADGNPAESRRVLLFRLLVTQSLCLSVLQQLQRRRALTLFRRPTTSFFLNMSMIR